MSSERDDERAMRPPARFRYVPIVDRPRYTLPGGKRLIVWPVVNIEEWDVAKPMPRTVSVPPGGQNILPDIQNWGWHEYGMRVGIWRILELFARYQLTPTVSINAKVCETRPRLAKAMLDAGWEFMAHCYEQMPISKVPDQRAMMRQTMDVLEGFTGRRPTGWLGPGRGQTFATMDYIAECGFRWFGDYVMDDLPFWADTRHGPLLSLPYTVELNDIHIMISAQHESDVFLKRVQLTVQALLDDARAHQSVRILSFAIHPYITGASHRIRFFNDTLRFLTEQADAVFMSGEEIYDWFSAQERRPG
jgi:hypothetical protein